MFRDLFNNMPTVTKNIFLLCVLMFIVQLSGDSSYGGYGISRKLSMYYIYCPLFEPYQIVTHMFCHGGIAHLLFNMLALISIGSLLERLWGPKRFLFFYLTTGFGAVILHQFAQGLDIYNAIGSLNPENIEIIPNGISYNKLQYSEEQAKAIMSIYTPVLGASGAVYGLLIGLAMLFPNIELMMFFIPVPIKAKYLVPVLIVLELFLGVNDFKFDNIAHFAHLGGALFGFILIRIWNRSRKKFY